MCVCVCMFFFVTSCACVYACEKEIDSRACMRVRSYVCVCVCVCVSYLLRYFFGHLATTCQLLRRYFFCAIIISQTIIHPCVSFLVCCYVIHTHTYTHTHTYIHTRTYTHIYAHTSTLLYHFSPPRLVDNITVSCCS